MTTPAASTSTKIDPVTAVQDSIDSLALSLFEALRGVRDAVADSSSSSTAAAAAADHMLPMSAFHDTDGRSTHVEEYAVNNNTTSVEDVQNCSINSNGILADHNQQQQQQQQAKDKLLDGLNLGYFPPRAYDRLNPDYESFILSYLGGEDGYAKELVERFYSLQKKTTPTTVTTTTSLTGTSDDMAKNEKIDQSKNIDQILLDTKTILPQLPQHQQQLNNTNLSETVDKNDLMRAGEEEEEHGAKSSSSSSLLTNTVKKLGEVGYEFRKEFDSGWYTGKVVEIRPLAENGHDRRCVYSDGDIEDLRLEDLEQLAKLDPLYGKNSIQNPTNSNVNRAKKPRLCIKLNVSKNKPPHISTSGAEQTSSSSLVSNTNAAMDTTSSSPPLFPMSRDDYIQLLHEAEHHRDYEITTQLAANVLSKSNAVNDLVANLPGMERTRSMQLARITELIDENRRVMSELEEAYVKANKIRDEGVRKTLGECTALALCLDEE